MVSFWKALKEVAWTVLKATLAAGRITDNTAGGGQKHGHQSGADRDHPEGFILNDAHVKRAERRLLSRNPAPHHVPRGLPRNTDSSETRVLLPPSLSPVGKRILSSSCNFGFDFHVQCEPGLSVQLEGRWITSSPARGRPEGLKPVPSMRTVFCDKFTTSRTQADPEC
ncbi:unnamed protein product [Rangifer tarandus platyrhynchus]|uniref:Uncharacterized protein n=3 Tax=Rangifer tarandus platyrhynchus TaxID=3082113 RepID=A0ACB0EGB8_RANTA|nr:unnamed protein product [Rangifer tarandus platyrhynchus]CAI9699655.1 unnamed protein product [Rangifer tarandus platyrhynchus]